MLILSLEKHLDFTEQNMAPPPHLSRQEGFDLSQLDVVKLLHHNTTVLTVSGEILLQDTDGFKTHNK